MLFAAAFASAASIKTITQVERAFSTGATAPAAGWAPANAIYSDDAPKGRARPAVVWSRIRFDPTRFGASNLALLTEDDSEDVVVFLNGRELFRNNEAPGGFESGWNSAYRVSLPRDLFLAGENVIDLRVSARGNLNVGRIRIGPAGEIEGAYEALRFSRRDGSRAANYAMLVMAAAAAVFYSRRGRSGEQALLLASVVVWFLIDYPYFSPRTPIAPWRLRFLSDLLIYPGMALSFGFCLAYARVPRFGFWFGVLCAGCGLLTVIHAVAGPSIVVELGALAMAPLVAGLLAWEGWRSRALDPIALTGAVIAITIANGLDAGRAAMPADWPGPDFPLLPYIWFVMAILGLTLMAARGTRAADALADLNRSLEQNIAHARAELAASEAERRRLEVAQALDAERERLMREMHDGIGSNLTMAITVARSRNHPEETISTLSKALADLKITVDSLEPVEGDLGALIANLRHRLAPDLAAAGIAMAWKVEDVPPLPWLDAANALHVLRLFQEAIGNALRHAGATTLEVGCREEARHDRSGLTVWVADDGAGFTPALTPGKGLGIMRDRALALHGEFDCVSAPGAGARISLWLPFERTAAA